MSAAILFARLQRHDVTLQADGDRLKVNAPKPLDAQVLAEVKAHKAALLELLAIEAKPDPEPAASTCSTPNADTSR